MNTQEPKEAIQGIIICLLFNDDYENVLIKGPSTTSPEVKIFGILFYI